MWAFGVFFLAIAIAVAFGVFLMRKDSQKGRGDETGSLTVFFAVLIGLVGLIFFAVQLPKNLSEYYFPRVNLHREDTPDCLEDREHQRLEKQLEEQKQQAEENEKRLKKEAEEELEALRRVHRYY
jgi:uncharacterized protein HemX